MAQTLLDMTQDILSSLDGSEVNSIQDNEEAMQVARIIKTCYNNITTNANLPEHYELFGLTASGDVTKPTLMTLPADVSNLIWVKYNKMENTDVVSNFHLITPLPLLDFLERMHSVDTSETNAGTFIHSSVTYSYFNDKAPDFYTSADDYTVLFDSYDSGIDTTLQNSKTLCWGQIGDTFQLTDAYVPDLDKKQMDLLFNEAKALAFIEQKQVQHLKAEQNARKGWIRTQKTKENVLQGITDFDKMPNYGRRR